MRKLEEHEKNWILDDIFNGYRIDETLKKLNLNTRREFDRILKADPEFKLQCDQARLDSIPYIENDLLNAHTICKNQAMSQTYSNNRFKILAAYLPERYGNKLDVNVNGHLSIRSNLDTANKRVEGMLRDVTSSAVEVFSVLSENTTHSG